ARLAETGEGPVDRALVERQRVQHSLPLSDEGRQALPVDAGEVAVRQELLEALGPVGVPEEAQEAAGGDVGASGRGAPESRRTDEPADVRHQALPAHPGRPDVEAQLARRIV